MLIDHLVYAVKDLHAGIRAIADRTGVTPVIGGQHPGWGTCNALLALGPNTYLEIIAPDPAQPRPLSGRALGVDGIDRPRLTRWAARTADIGKTALAAAAVGLSIGNILDGRRERPDGSVLRWRLSDPYTDPSDGIFPFFIDWLDSPHPAAAAPAGCRLLGLRAEHPDPDRVSARLSAMSLDLAVVSGPVPALLATLETPNGIFVLR